MAQRDRGRNRFFQAAVLEAVLSLGRDSRGHRHKVSPVAIRKFLQTNYDIPTSMVQKSLRTATNALQNEGLLEQVDRSFRLPTVTTEYEETSLRVNLTERGKRSLLGCTAEQSPPKASDMYLVTYVHDDDCDPPSYIGPPPCNDDERRRMEHLFDYNDGHIHAIIQRDYSTVREFLDLHEEELRPY